jgi:hypothetical protein
VHDSGNQVCGLEARDLAPALGAVRKRDPQETHLRLGEGFDSANLHGEPQAVDDLRGPYQKGARSHKIRGWVSPSLPPTYTARDQFLPNFPFRAWRIDLTKPCS